MISERHALALETTRDLLKLNGAGAIACFAIAPNMGDMHILVWMGGGLFAIGLLDSLWTIRKLASTKQLAGESIGEAKVSIDAGLLIFALAVLACTVGTIATNFSKTTPDARDNARHEQMADSPQ